MVDMVFAERQIIENNFRLLGKSLFGRCLFLEARNVIEEEFTDVLKFRLYFQEYCAERLQMYYSLKAQLLQSNGAGPILMPRIIRSH